MEFVDAFKPVARSGVLWNERFSSDCTVGIATGRPFNVPVPLRPFCLRFMSATLAYTKGALFGDAGGVVALLSIPLEENLLDVIIVLKRLFCASVPCCRENSSSNSAAVMRLEVGRDLILATLGCVGVPGPCAVGVDMADECMIA